MGEKNCKLRKYLMTGKELDVMDANEGNERLYFTEKYSSVYLSSTHLF